MAGCGPRLIAAAVANVIWTSCKRLQGKAVSAVVKGPEWVSGWDPSRGSVRCHSLYSVLVWRLNLGRSVTPAMAQL